MTLKEMPDFTTAFVNFLLSTWYYVVRCAVLNCLLQFANRTREVQFVTYLLLDMSRHRWRGRVTCFVYVV